ncbi:MAG: MBL fold metallo-hydrolase [Nocardioidaceae bacterium]
MRLTHLGHACLLVVIDDQQILIDPGNLAGDLTALTELDAVVTTHQHADHVDPERFSAIVAANPRARLFAEPETADLIEQHFDLPVTPERLHEGEDLHVGTVVIRPIGSRHARNHDGVRRCGNVGVVLGGDSGPTFYHPGDAYDGEPGRVDVLAVPLNAPWTAVRDTIDFVRRISPRTAIPIHDGLLTEAGRQAYLGHVAGFAREGTTVLDLSDGRPSEVS